MLCLSTFGPESWRQRLAPREASWKRRSVPFELAVSWELANKQDGAMPTALAGMFDKSGLGPAKLLLAVVGYQRRAAIQPAVFRTSVSALLTNPNGPATLAVYGTGRGAYDSDGPLEKWLQRGYGETGKARRLELWEHLRSFLPSLKTDAATAPYQLLTCCAVAVMEARRLGFRQAMFIVQAFKASEPQFAGFASLCEAFGVPALRDELIRTDAVQGISLALGWKNCPYATDAEIAAAMG